MVMRMNPLLALAAALLVHGPVIGPGTSEVHAAELASQIEGLLRSVPASTVEYGVAVVDAENGRLVFSRNAEQPLIPASNQKLLVMAAGLELLGRRFEFRTVLGLRRGDLVIIGDGDPAIGDPKLCEPTGDGVLAMFHGWARALLNNGHTSIPGDLIIDESIFDEQLVHPSWEAADVQKWYGAPVGALNLHDNCIEVTVWPATQPGDAALWSVTPPATIVEIINRVRSGGAGVPVIAGSGEPFRFILSGSCGSRAALEPVPAPDPGLLFADVFRGVLESAGFGVAGELRRERVRTRQGALPGDIEIIAVHRTPIGDVLTRIGKDSQNLFAECLAKRIGYEHMRRTSGAPARGSWVTASSAVQAFGRRIGMDTSGMVFADASGLSRDNRVTAGQFVDLLVYMFRRGDRDIFMESLAVPGKEGSLRKRMRGLEGSVLAKTGTLRGVKSLSGYVRSDGRTYAFSIIFNGYQGPSAPYKRIQDQFCRLLAAHSE